METQSYGKFASAEELLKGYTQLEKSFTQKCQQLSALEKERLGSTQQNANALPTEEALTKQTEENFDGTNAEASPLEAEQSTTVDSAQTVPQGDAGDGVSLNGQAAASTIPTDEQLQQYLANNPEVARRLLQQSPQEFAPNVMSGGGNVSMALPSRPKTIKEASLMAKDLFR